MSTQEFLAIFLYSQNWNTSLNIVFLCVGGVYMFSVRSRVAGWQRICFLLSLIVYYVSFGSPIALLAHELFSIHMLQMSLLYFVMPPLLLLGIPSYMFRYILRSRILKKCVIYCTQPLVSLFFFNGLISLYHIPLIFDLLMSRGIYHIFSHLILLGAAVCMWWPIIAPLPEMSRLKPLHQLGLIFANGILLTPACAMITFTDTLLYAIYGHMSQLVPVISPLHDQQLGGVIMKITQEIVYITAICFVFFRWAWIEKKKDSEELYQWKNEQIERRRGI